MLLPVVAAASAGVLTFQNVCAAFPAVCVAFAAAFAVY